MSKLELEQLTVDMIVEPVGKPWYKSKTIWLNVVGSAVFFTEGLSTVLTGMGPLLGPALPWVVFGLAILNLMLRTITDVGIER